MGANADRRGRSFDAFLGRVRFRAGGRLVRVSGAGSGEIYEASRVIWVRLRSWRCLGLRLARCSAPAWEGGGIQRQG